MIGNTSPRGPGLFSIARDGAQPVITNIRRLAGTERGPGSLLVTAGMALLALLDGGLLYVVFAAQDRFIFAVKHQNVAAMIQALALDVAMIIFSVLGLGLARKGLPAPVERALIVVCALASAFMNWTASDHTSLRSVAVYVSAPILLALVTDRVIGGPPPRPGHARRGQRLGPVRPAARPRRAVGGPPAGGLPGHPYRYPPGHPGRDAAARAGGGGRGRA